MIRRLIRFAVAAFCLLSLLAAAGVTWLWWEYRQGRGYVAEGAVGGTYVMVSSEASDVRVGVTVVRGWPGRRFAWVGAYSAYKERELFWIPTRLQRWERMHLFGQVGAGSLFVQRGTREPLRKLRGAIRFDSLSSWSSCSARSWNVLGIPHQVLMVVTLLPPLLWAGVRWRRRRERRRRVRLWLCLA